MIVMEGDRLRDRLEMVLPDREEFAQPPSELAIWLNSTPDSVLSACRALQRFGAAQMKLGKQRTGPRSNTTRTTWWRP
jgi:hypothetical protein